MTIKVRTLLAVAVVGAACTMATAAYGETTASGKSTPAQYAAVADDICTGVPTREREMGLLAFRDNIVSVSPLNEFHFAGKAKYLRTEGAVIKLRATPGISVPWLERVNGCHIALMGSGRLVGSETSNTRRWADRAVHAAHHERSARLNRAVRGRQAVLPRPCPMVHPAS